MVFLGDLPELSDVSYCQLEQTSITIINPFFPIFLLLKMGNCLRKFALNNCTRLQMSSVSSLVSSSDDEDTDFESVYGRLQLPWHENYWHIKVTHVVSPNEVWAVLTENAVN